MRPILLLLILFCCVSALLAHDTKPSADNDEHDADIANISLPDRVTYHELVRPIIEAHCTACHSDGQIAAYAPLTDAYDVVAVAEDIAFQVVNRIMPPWMPSDLTVPLKRDRSLSIEEIAIVAAWLEQGAELGEPDTYVPPDEIYALAEVRADLTLQLDEAYHPEHDAQDDYRCFAFALDIEAPQFLTAYEFIPEVAEMAHHGIVYLLDDVVAADIAERDYADGRPGWSCYGGTGLSKSGDIIGTWTPGTFGIRFPEGTGYLIEPGQFVVVQMHYNLWTTRAPDRTQVKMELESGDSDLTKLMTLPLSAPVEIPCPSGVEGPQCEREYALERITELYGEKLRNLPDRRLNNCNQTLADYADNTGENARAHCDFPSPFPFTLTVYGVLGHMHELGRSFHMELNPGADDSIMLLDIPNWNFHWQDRYQFVEPVEVNFGDFLRMSCHWDNSLSDDPRYVVWGEGTSDEMCFGTVMVGRP